MARRRREVPTPELRCPTCRAELERFWAYCPDCGRRLEWRDAARVTQLVRDVVATEPAVALEYAEAVDAHELTPLTTLDGSVSIAVAAEVGPTRLIDNVLVRIDGAGVEADLGVVRPAPPLDAPLDSTPA